MRWRAEWDALSATIDRLREAGNFLVRADPSLGAGPSEKGIGTYWVPALVRTAEALALFLEKNREFFTGPAALQIHNWYKQMSGLLQLTGGSFQTLQFGLSHLLAAQAEINLAISDLDVTGRRVVERAFLHLQRSLVVDPDLRARWVDAYENVGEREIEKLGAVHLLSHGVWAFKASGVGERTDLVLGTPLAPLIPEVTRSADVLVLTEWKVVKDEKEQENAFGDALRQAKLYSEGILGGLELKSVRYLVLVSPGRLPARKDVTVSEITYRHVNVAIRPQTPSHETVAIVSA